jgi:hypothetical protein
MKGRDDLPAGDSTPLMDAAIAIHEMFVTYVGAGFNRKEALYLVAEQIKAAPTPEGGSEGGGS